MGIEAVALLHISSAVLAETLEPVPGSPGALRGPSGDALEAVALEDATLLRGIAPFDAEPDELAARLRELLGDALARHEDDRGVYLFPDVAKPRATTYAAVIEELGEVGFWVSLGGPSNAHQAPRAALPPELRTQLDDLMGGVDAEALGELQRAMASSDPADLAKLSTRLQRELGEKGEIPESLQQSMQDALEEAQRFMGSPAGGEAPPPAPALPLGGDLTALADAARQQLEALSDAERDQVAALARQFGLPVGDPSDLMAALGGLGAALAPGPAAPPEPSEPSPAQAPPKSEPDDDR